MNNTKEILLFFNKEYDFKPVQIANEIMSRYEVLGNPVLLPMSNNSKSTILVFNTCPDFQISLNKVCLTIAINHNFFDELENIIFDMVDTFEGFNIKFSRIGYLDNKFYPSKKINIIKEKYVNQELMGDMSEFNISWYTKIPSKAGDINCWQRFITDTAQYSDLLYQFDFNTMFDKEFDFTMKNIKIFFKTTKEFSDSKEDNL